ncbi:MAG: hypothetical protein EUB_02259 [Eubacterium sp.]
MGSYDDIINHPHHVSKTRSQMSELDRAAQFSPFAALTGYDAAIKETGRLTGDKLNLDDGTKAILDMKQAFLMEVIDTRPEITISYFLPDTRKSGGEYVTVTGILKRFDEYERMLILTDGKKIPLDDIADIECELFTGFLGGDVL